MLQQRCRRPWLRFVLVVAAVMFGVCAAAEVTLTTSGPTVAGESSTIVFGCPDGLTATVAYVIGDRSAGLAREGVVITPPSPVDCTQALSVKANASGYVVLEVNASSTETCGGESGRPGICKTTCDGVACSEIEVRFVSSAALETVTVVFGWIYFAAWTLSFYPQVYLNWSRQSVVGYHFDFLAYNLTGFLAYGGFNIAMYLDPTVMLEYREKHPGSTNPVHLNDVFFTVHAVFITLVTIGQCIVYESGGQKVSNAAKVLVTALWTFIIVCAALAGAGEINTLAFFDYASYVKIVVTLVKYVPQALLNYRRKSTEGWSIGNILLDLAGGVFSLAQMTIQSINNSDLTVFVGDPTKLGLAFFSILFDVLFVLQVRLSLDKRTTVLTAYVGGIASAIVAEALSFLVDHRLIQMMVYQHYCFYSNTSNDKSYAQDPDAMTDGKPLLAEQDNL